MADASSNVLLQLARFWTTDVSVFTRNENDWTQKSFSSVARCLDSRTKYANVAHLIVTHSGHEIKRYVKLLRVEPEDVILR
jgi:hypothetical protein